MSLQDVFDIVTFVFVLGAFAFIAVMMASVAKDAFGEAFGKSESIERYNGSTGAVMDIIDEKIDDRKKVWMLHDENYELKKALNDDALKFQYVAEALKDMKMRHDGSMKQDNEIDGIIRELEGFASESRERAGDAE